MRLVLDASEIPPKKIVGSGRFLVCGHRSLLSPVQRLGKVNGNIRVQLTQVASGVSDVRQAEIRMSATGITVSLSKFPESFDTPHPVQGRVTLL